MTGEIIGLREILADISIDPSPTARDLARRYGYLPYMVERYIRILGDEVIDLLNAMENPSILRPVARCNSLRIECTELERRLRRLGFKTRRLEWAPEAIEIIDQPESPSIGATHEYLKGFYYLHRDYSPLIPPLAMRLGRGQRILDSCAAPGGKATYMAQLIGDDGTIIANDISINRLRSLVSNIMRMGFKSIIVTRIDARRIHKDLRMGFERILVDAPCSAEGYIMIDPDRKRRTDQRDLAQLVKREIEILVSSLELLEPGGLLAYSTCSIAPEENEYVVSRALRHYGEEFDIVDPGLSFWSRGIMDLWIGNIDPGVSRCIRTWPHKHGAGGSFVCIIRRR